MTKEQARKQLISMQNYCESMIDKNDSEDIWAKDVIALDMALDSMEREKLLEEELRKEKRESITYLIMLGIIILVATLGVIL